MIKRPTWAQTHTSTTLDTEFIIFLDEAANINDNTLAPEGTNDLLGGPVIDLDKHLTPKGRYPCTQDIDRSLVLDDYLARYRFLNKVLVEPQ